MTAYWVDGPKRVIEQALEEVDNISLDYEAIIQSVSNIRGHLLELGLTTEQAVSSSINVVQNLDSQIEEHLKQLFSLRTILNDIKGAL